MDRPSFIAFVVVGYLLLLMVALGEAFREPLLFVDWLLPLRLAVFALPVYILVLIWYRAPLVATDVKAGYLPLLTWCGTFFALQACGWWRPWCVSGNCDHFGKGACNFFLVEPPSVLR